MLTFLFLQKMHHSYKGYQRVIHAVPSEIVKEIKINKMIDLNYGVYNENRASTYICKLNKLYKDLTKYS